MKNTILWAMVGMSFFLPALASAKTVDKTPPKLLSLHISSSAANPSFAKPGDTVTISFTASEKVTPIVLAETRTLFVKATNSGGNTWDATYTVNPKDQQEKVEYLITLVDTAGNIFICSSPKLPIIAYCPTTDGSSVTIDKTAPLIGAASFTSPLINAATQHAAGFNVKGPANESDTVAYTISDSQNHTISGTGVTTAGIFNGSADVSALVDGTLVLTARLIDQAGNQSAPTTTSTLKDATPPAISPQADIIVQTSNSQGTTVNYSTPTAIDAHDGAVAVACAPISGSLFAVGSTTVSCNAQDAAGNSASSSFVVGVAVTSEAAPPPPPGTPFVMASQQDESVLCTPDWRNCYTGGTSERVIPLGQGSALGGGTLQSVTIAKDENSPFVSQPWVISILCYVDAAHTQSCPDWVAANGWNGNQHSLVLEETTATTDNKHWTASFTTPNEANFDGSSPVTFNPAYYYDLVINDNGFDIAAYGSATEPYWILTGITQ